MGGFISGLLLHLREHWHSTAFLCNQDLNLIKATQTVKFLPFYIPFPLFSAPAIRSLLHFHTTFLQQPILIVTVSPVFCPWTSISFPWPVPRNSIKAPKRLELIGWAEMGCQLVEHHPQDSWPVASHDPTNPTLDLLTLPLSCPSPAVVLFQGSKEFWHRSSLCLSAEKNSVRAKWWIKSDLL